MTDVVLPAGFARRLAAWLYDSLLVFGIWLVSLTILFALLGSTVSRPTLQTIVFLEAFVFYTWFWTRHGRTLGMQAWRLRIVDAAGRPPSLRAATVRFFVAIASLTPLGFVWVMFDPQSRSLADIASGTRTVRLEPGNDS